MNRGMKNPSSATQPLIHAEFSGETMKNEPREESGYEIMEEDDLRINQILKIMYSLDDAAPPKQELAWATEEFIEEQLDRYSPQVNRAHLPKLVAQALMPDWASPHELLSLSWFGDWRPTSMLGLLRTLAHSPSSSIPGSHALDCQLDQLMHDTCIHETVLDGEMAEIQATCILHLPFAMRRPQSGDSKINAVLPEFRKLNLVIAKAHRLRFETMERVTKMVSGVDAAEFLVVLASIRDSVHRFAMTRENGAARVA